MSEERRKLVKALKEKQLTIAIAESVTCGLAAHKLSVLPGISEVLAGSVVCYSPEVKRSLLGVPQNLIDKYTCESAQVTHLLAENLRKVIRADIHAAVTGLASPGGSETKNKPVGTIFISVRYKKKIYNKRFVFRGTPTKVKAKACDTLYGMALKYLNND
ncbi:MAG: CinA family protein [Bacteroidia bacterium]